MPTSVATWLDPARRDAWIRSLRPPLDEHRRSLPVNKAARWISEMEPDALGRLRSGVTFFLTNRECPWRCLMCDLWRETTLQTVPVGAIPEQIRRSLESAPAADWIKLYNAGSFFDAGAIPPADHPAIAALCRPFSRLIVECHPTLVGLRALTFRDRLGGTELEVALGLESANPEVLARLNKRMTRDDFARAAGFLRSAGIGVRTFVLVKPPFQDDAEAREWAIRSTEFALDAGAEVVSLIPTRGGPGALEEMAHRGEFAEPGLELLEDCFDAAITVAKSRGNGRVFADVWDLERFAAGRPAVAERRARLEEMNRRQCVLPRVSAGTPT